MLKKPCLRKHHNTVHLNWATKIMSYVEKCLSTILRDVKKQKQDWQIYINFTGMVLEANQAIISEDRKVEDQ